MMYQIPGDTGYELTMEKEGKRFFFIRENGSVADTAIYTIGRPTSGGACAVQSLVSADGTLWRISGRQRLSTLCNGAFYDVDQGVAPDVVLARDENDYDRQGLTDMINAMKECPVEKAKGGILDEKNHRVDFGAVRRAGAFKQCPFRKRHHL